MKTIYLHGRMGELFGTEYRLDVASPVEALRALDAQMPGFRQEIEANDWHIVKGEDLKDPANYLDEELVTFEIGNIEEIHFIPATVGAGGGGFGGVFNIVAGGALVAIGLTVPGMQALTWVGAGMIAGGVSSMFITAPAASTPGSRESAEERPSFSFDRPVNTATQGLPVPLIYGDKVRVGSVVVSSGLSVEDIPIDDEDDE